MTAAGSEYDRKYDALAARFVENFKVLAAGCPPGTAAHGPQRLTGAPAEVGS